MFVNPGFEGLKIVSARKDGGGVGFTQKTDIILKKRCLNLVYS